VRAIFEDDEAKLTELLSDIPANVDLWEATDRHLQAADTLFRALDSLAGIGETKASKLLARKRPRLFACGRQRYSEGTFLGLRSRMGAPGGPSPPNAQTSSRIPAAVGGLDFDLHYPIARRHCMDAFQPITER